MITIEIKLNKNRFRKKLIRKNRVANRKSKNKILIFNYKSLDNTIIIKDFIKAPRFFNYLKYPLECNYFFSSLRMKENCSIIRGEHSFKICLKNTIEIDFAAISILKSIMEEARRTGISFSGNLPKDIECKKFLIEYGFLNNLAHNGDQKINILSNGQYFFYEKKEGKLTIKDFMDFDLISGKAYKGVTGLDGYFDDVITAFKEIGSNAVEWSRSKFSQWMVGYYEKDGKVIINVTDLGLGILDTLYRSGNLQFIDFFVSRTDLRILEGAFIRRYGSLSQEINRNKGLPFIKRIFDEGKIKNLVVSTNKIFYNFGNRNDCKISPKLQFNFLGTFYQWELDNQCIDKYE